MKVKFFLLIIFLFATIFYFDFFNINHRLKFKIFQVVKIVDEHIFKTKSFPTDLEKLSLLIIGHPYGNYEFDEKNGKQIHPSVIKHAEQKIAAKSVDSLVLLGDLVERISFGNMRTAFKQIYSINKNPIIVLGNHDAGDHDLNPAAYYLLWANKMSSFYLLEWGKTAIFILNSTKDIHDIDQSQVEFIRKEIEAKKFKTYIFLTHHVLWVRDTSYDNLINNGSMFSKKQTSSKLIEIIDDINLNQPEAKTVIISGDLGNKSGYVSFLETKNSYFGVGFGNKGNSQRVGGTSLFLEVDHNGNFEVEQSNIN